MTVDYSLYLVTDSTMIPSTSTFLKQVEDAVNNGATLVQLREKEISTLDFIERAKQVHKLTKPKNVPLIINDRVDVALAVDAEGVHVGQDDMPATLVRKLIGPNKILGVTCSNPNEVRQVVREGVADYVGLGTTFATNTKKDVKTPDGVGPIGIRKQMHELSKDIRCVAIGGINHSNANRVVHQCRVGDRSLDGIAVVSCIMASEDAAKATRTLRAELDHTPEWAVVRSFDKRIPNHAVVKNMTSQHPLVHHITNNVVKNFSANVTLAIGASPIMSELPEEFEEFASAIPNIGLVVNLGTPNAELMKVFSKALTVYNKYNKPIVFDPVACGASRARLESCRKLLNQGVVSVIKGNVGEIMSIWKLTPFYQEDVDTGESHMRGVDSISNAKDAEVLEKGVQVATTFGCTVVITGKINYIIGSDKRSVQVAGGDALMGSITGTGCSLGSTIAAFLAAESASPIVGGDILKATEIAVRLYNRAGAEAGKLSKSPGSFMISFLDQLSEVSQNPEEKV
ncbi:THI6 [Candida theae]|uniref:THI6 n=1 Tax=Candida theae TaxID=1198502 RepID=A0AAD5BEP1_9ASCO|nr:THI6 [Candida theae]KAI5958311.1 THI6 [Candida theae]